MPQSLDMKIAYAWKTAAVGTSFVGFGLVFAWTARQDDPRWCGNFAADVYRHIELPTMGFVFFGFLSAFLVSLKGQFHEIVDPFYSNGFFIGIILTNKKLSRNFLILRRYYKSNFAF